MRDVMYGDLQKRFSRIIAIIVIAIMIGTIGYKILGGPDWTILDALYMTIITITTVGYGEIHSLGTNPHARIFTIFFVLFGMAVIVYGMGNLTAFIIEGDLKHLMWRRRIMKRIRKMKSHYIICGGGEIGMHTVDEFVKTKRNFVLIESDMEKIEAIRQKIDIPILQGDATDDDTLHAAGIQSAAGIISTLHSDKDNLFITVSARQLNPSIRIVVQSVDPATQKKLFRSGANAVVSTNAIGAMRLVSEMVRPNVVTFLDQMLRVRDQTIRIEEVTLRKDSPYVDKNLFQSNIGKETGVLVIAIRNPETHQFNYSFSPDLRLKVGDILVVIGTVEQIKALRIRAGEEITEVNEDDEEVETA